MRKNVVSELRRVAMGMDMESILGIISKKIHSISQDDTPFATTKSAKLMSLAMSNIKVNTAKFTKKEGMVSSKILRLMMAGPTANTP
jgi:hypothetical protein